MSVNAREILEAVPPFNLLPPGDLDKLEPGIKVRTYQPGTYVFRQGEESLGTLFLVVRGLAEGIITGGHGDETVVGLRGAEDFFGETALAGGQYSGSIRVKEEMTCLLIPGDEIARLTGRHGDFAGYLNELLLKRMRLLYKEIVSEQPFEAYNWMEPPLFRKRVSEIMSSPVVTCSPDDHVDWIARLMKDKKTSAAVVVEGDNRPAGLITNAILVHKILARSVTDYPGLTAGAVMSRKIFKIPAEASLAEAVLAVSRFNVRHMAAISGERLVGIVTPSDLVKTRSTGSLVLVHDIESKQDLNELARVGRDVDDLLSALIAEKAPVQEILAIMAGLHERLTVRVIQLCEQEMVRQGHGAPPVEYCWVNMGSAGRLEQTIRTDQDNFIIFRDDPAVKAGVSREYFFKLAVLVNAGLEQCGFAGCPYNVMASNPVLCKSLGEWERLIERWIGYLVNDPRSIRQLTNLLDSRAVYGDRDLAGALWRTILKVYGESAAISHYLTKDDLLSTKAPISRWGGFVTEKSGPHKDEINLKRTAVVHIVNCVRIFTVRNGISETNTFKRLAELRKKGALSDDEAGFIETAYETLLMFRIRENLKKVKRGEKADNYINPAGLSVQEREILKGAFTAVSRLQKLTGSTFTLEWLRHK